MINPLTVMKIINERHEFVKNHMDFFPFLKENFGENMVAGTVITVNVKTPEGKDSTIDLEVQESELPLYKTLADLLSQIA